MRKARFNNRQSIELSRRLGANLTADQSEVIQLEGWLVDNHVCVQKPISKIGAAWRVSLYPWGHVVSGDFYIKDDAIAYAEDLHALGIDWQELYGAAKFGQTPAYQRALDQAKPFNLGLRFGEAGALARKRAHHVLQRLYIIRQGREIDVHESGF